MRAAGGEEKLTFMGSYADAAGSFDVRSVAREHGFILELSGAPSIKDFNLAYVSSLHITPEGLRSLQSAGPQPSHRTSQTCVPRTRPNATSLYQAGLALNITTKFLLLTRPVAETLFDRYYLNDGFNGARVRVFERMCSDLTTQLQHIPRTSIMCAPYYDYRKPEFQAKLSKYLERRKPALKQEKPPPEKPEEKKTPANIKSSSSS